MTNRITGCIATALVVVFLGTYAVKINSLPLWVIIVAVLAMQVGDVVHSIYRERQDRATGGTRRDES